MPATDASKRRASKSPARSKSPAKAKETKSPARSKSPAKAKETKSPASRKSPASTTTTKHASKSPAKARPTATPKKPSVPLPAAPKSAAKSAPTPKSAKLPAFKRPTNMFVPLDKLFTVLVFVAFPTFLLLTAGFLPTSLPSMPSLFRSAKAKNKLKLTNKLSLKAFDGTTLKHADGYRGSTLVSFLMDDCVHCKGLKKTIAKAQQEPAFEGKLKFGYVDCAKQVEICTRFGVSGDDESASGYPYLMWFRAGAQVGAYEGERSFEGLYEWMVQKEEQGLLFSHA